MRAHSESSKKKALQQKEVTENEQVRRLRNQQRRELISGIMTSRLSAKSLRKQFHITEVIDFLLKFEKKGRRKEISEVFEPLTKLDSSKRNQETKISTEG